MKGKILSLIIIGLLLWGGFNLIKGKKLTPTGPNLQGVMVLYYGDTCPHCEDVKKFIKDKGIERKLGLEQKEVYNNTENKAELVKQAALCGIPSTQIGVPLLWNGNGCSYGTPEIEKFLQAKLDEK